jgi:hypothetical protein
LSAKSDTEIVVERVQSEALGALMSIHSYREIGDAYFDRFRAAVSIAIEYFVVEPSVPAVLLKELAGSARVLRNEASTFPGRTAACMAMADWLDEASKKLCEKLSTEIRIPTQT